jgi:hypothetical protein
MNSHAKYGQVFLIRITGIDSSEMQVQSDIHIKPDQRPPPQLLLVGQSI